ncbi:MAG: hypothetical protein GY931_06170 [Maribacter sp.]|nr:hypothetical protein [Maribacter sp.]
MKLLINVSLPEHLKDTYTVTEDHLDCLDEQIRYNVASIDVDLIEQWRDEDNSLRCLKFVIEADVSEFEVHIDGHISIHPEFPMDGFFNSVKFLSCQVEGLPDGYCEPLESQSLYVEDQFFEEYMR